MISKRNSASSKRNSASRPAGLVTRPKATKWAPGTGEDTVSSIPSQYAMHQYLLNFLDPEVEQRYFDFQYVDNAFIPGKIFSLTWTSVCTMSFIYFTEPWYNNASYTVESFTSLWWIGSYISGILNFNLGICLHLERFKPYREIIHLIQLVIGWPANIMIFLIIKRPAAYGMGNLFGSFFSFLIAQPRMCRVMPIAVIWPIICLFVITFSVPGYWDDHTYIEMLYWLATPTPVFLLSFLEKQTRKSFIDREMAMEAIKESEHKTAVTQRMIANFFPQTPTRDLLQQVDGPRDKAYPDTVLIVTDIVGFTAHTSRSDPLDVIDMITVMFQAFDSAAEQYSVEKIATVGDSYCGAVFATPDLTATERCANAMQFACTTLGCALPLQMRVGVHIGDVVGVFVGCAPPKFDVFGEGIDVAREMEEGSEAGFVHFTRAIADAIACYMDDFNHRPSELGHLCESFGMSSLPAVDGDDGVHVLHNDVPTIDPQPVLVGESIVKALCAFTSSENVDGASDTEEDMDAKEDAADTEFNILTLTFNRPKLEKKYQRKFQTLGLNFFCGRVLLASAFWLFVIQLNLQCNDEQSLGVASATIAILTLYINYLQFVGTDNRFHGLLTWLLYNSLFIISMLGLTGTCSRHTLQAIDISSIVGCYSCLAMFGPQYCLDVRAPYRVMMSGATSVLWCVTVAIRRSTFEDEVGVWDAMPLLGACFAIMSFFPDYSLRSAFRSEVQLEALQKAAKSKRGHMAESAMAIMLPTFVTERIIALAREAAQDPLALAPTHSETASSYSSCEGGAAEVDFNNVATTWEYNHCVIMFIKFHSDDADFTPHKIHMGVQAIEEAAKRFGVKKVKTIGSTVMLVGGIDDPRTRQEHMFGMVDTAIMVQAIFQAMKVANLEYRIGIHSGPCFGAVIGGNGAIFDLFGDTVNTASRMMSTSEPRSIQLSPSANSLLLPGVYDVHCRAGVPIKGKGNLDLFTIEANVLPEQLTAFEDFFTGKTPVPQLESSQRKLWDSSPGEGSGVISILTGTQGATTQGERSNDYVTTTKFDGSSDEDNSTFSKN